MSPLILSALLVFIGSTNDHSIRREPAWHGYLLAFALFAANGVASIFMEQYVHCALRVGMHMRAGVQACVYRKALRVSSAAKRDITMGETVNLVSVDAQRLEDIMRFFNMASNVKKQTMIITAFGY